MQKYNLCVVGAGSIGGLIAASIAHSCNNVNVSIIARGKHLEAIKENGLIIRKSGCQDLSVKNITAVNDSSLIGKQDIVFLGVKSHQLKDIVTHVRKLSHEKTILVTVQNGFPFWYFHKHLNSKLEGKSLEAIDPGGFLLKNYECDNIIGCISYPAAKIVEPGVIFHEYGNRFPIGEIQGTWDTERVAALSNIMEMAGFRSRVCEDIRGEIWVKLLGSAFINPATALTQTSFGEFILSDEGKKIASCTMEEINSVALAVGITIRVSISKRLEGMITIGDHNSSMLEDIRAGRSVELDSLLGGILELAKEFDVKVPYCNLLYSLALTLSQNLILKEKCLNISN